MSPLFSWFFLVGGIVVLLVVLVDALATTLAVATGAGPVTRRVLGTLWSGLLRLHGRDREASWLTWAGTLSLIATVLMWVLGLWLGWALVFLGSSSVVDSKTQAPAEALDVFYFTGMTLCTLGTGDYVANAPAWRLVSVVASFSGLFLITLAITYLVSVLSAVVVRRSVAIQIHGLGDTVCDTLVRAWDGTQFSAVYHQQLVDLAATIAGTAEQHLAYPVLHYFHSPTRDLSAPVAIAHLDEVLTTLSDGVVTEARADPSAVAPLRRAITRFLDTATVAARSTSAEPPGPPPLEPLARAGIPVVDGTTFRAVVTRLHERRSRLHRLVNNDGWSWAGPAD